jgi:hypothetical protein
MGEHTTTAGLVSAVDAAMRTGLAGGSQEMVSAFPAAAVAGGFDLSQFIGEPVRVDWPEIVVEETGAF